MRKRVKGIDRPFKLMGKHRFLQSVMLNLGLGKHHLINFNVTFLTGQSHFLLIFFTPQGEFIE